MNTIGKTTIIPSMDEANPDDWDVRTPQAEFWYVAGDDPSDNLPGYPEGIVISFDDEDTSISIVITEDEIFSMLRELSNGRKRFDEYMNKTLQLPIDEISANE